MRKPCRRARESDAGWRRSSNAGEVNVEASDQQQGHRPPSRQGLYDPANEHDACGLGFVAHIKGRKSHSIVTQGLAILRNLTHRGATGADPLQGDGAGILIQLPDRSSAAPAASWGSRCRRSANTASAWCSCRRKRRRGLPANRKSSGRSPPRARCCSAGATFRSTTADFPSGRRKSSPSSGRCSSAAVRAIWMRTRWNASCTSSASARDTRSRRSTCGMARSSTCRRSRRGRSSTRACSSPTRSASSIATCPTSRWSRRWRWCTSAFPPTRSRPGTSRIRSFRLPQRRDQHAAGELQLDPRA